MKTEDYKRLVSRMNEVQPSDKAAILVTMDCGGNINVSTFGEPKSVDELRTQVFLKTHTRYQTEGGEA